MLTKSPREFYDIMAEAYRDATGFDPAAASDIGIRMKALAEVLGAFTKEAAAAWRDAFPQTAAGEALDRHAESWGLFRSPAHSSGGTLRFYRATPAAAEIPIPAGTICAAEGDLRFATTASGKIEAGKTHADLPAAAQEAGEGGNVPPGAVKTLLSGVAGVAGVTNPMSFSGGSPAELDDVLRARLLRLTADPPAVANEAFYRETALAFPAVRSVKVLPGQRGSGSLDVVIAANPGHSAAEVVPVLGDTLAEVRAVGVDLLVRAAREVPCEVAAMAVLSPNLDRDAVLNACKAALSGYIAGLGVGENLYLAPMTARLMGVEGVENLRFVSPSADIAIPADGLATASVLDVEAVASL